MADNLIRVELAKGCCLFLTKEEYTRGLKRDKAIKKAAFIPGKGSEDVSTRF